MNYPFIMVSAPRSGSHMLATALGSHPALNFEGEYRDPNKSRINEVMNFTLVHAMPYNVELLSSAPDKVIVIRRNLTDRYLSKLISRKNSNGVKVKFHYTAPERIDLGTIPVPKELDHINVINQSQVLLDAFISDHPSALVMDYDDLTGGVDTREFSASVSDEICDYLGIERLALRPSTYKPAMNYKIESEQ